MSNRSKQRRLSPDDVISMFNSLKHDSKTLSNKEVTMINEKELQESLPQSNKINRLYAKKSDGTSLVIQKNSQKGG